MSYGKTNADKYPIGAIIRCGDTGRLDLVLDTYHEGEHWAVTVIGVNGNGLPRFGERKRTHCTPFGRLDKIVKGA